MTPQYINNCLTVCELESYAAWPNFKPIKSMNLGGLWRTSNLRDALTLDDLSCAAWRAPIPREILLTLQQFPECHAELIEMAQAVPEIYLDMVKLNPALTLLAATYWTFRTFGGAPSIEDRVVTWENLDADDLLQYTRCDSSKSFLKTLSKIPFVDANHFLIHALRDHWQFPQKRRLFQHLQKIRVENAWLLSCYPPIFDPAIHMLAANEPIFEEYTIVEIVSDLSSRRELKGLEFWPYRNRIHTWPQLLTAYNKFLHKTNHVLETFPDSPINGEEMDGLEIVPIKSRTALRREAAEMLNCVESFVVQIGLSKNYAYKLTRPERATVLLMRERGKWRVEEAMIKSNEREVSPETMKLLRQWIRSHRQN
jgi:hypothetical protein